MLNLEDILDKVQELIGAPQGAYYNMQARVRSVDAVHSNLVRETLAVTRRGRASLVAGDPVVRDFPPDFLGFAGSPIVFAQEVTTPGTLPLAVLFGTSNILFGVDALVFDRRGEPGEKVVVGEWAPLSVISSRDLEATYRAWDADTRVDTPHSIVIRAPRVCEVFPRPKFDAALEFSYVSDGGGVRAAEGGSVLEWVPFGGDPMLNEFANTIAYKVASDLMVSRNAEVSAYLRSLYEKDVRRMRHMIRYDPAKDIFVAPQPRGGYWYGR